MPDLLPPKTPTAAGAIPRRCVGWAVRPGATEHGPKGRAQCRGWAGGQTSDDTSRAPPQAACLISIS
jgi:hypothetical protein